MLKAVVGIMGVLIVLGTTVVAATIVHRLYANAAGASMPAVRPPSGWEAPALLPAGSHIAGIAAAGGGIAVWVSGPGGDQLWLVNPQTGAHVVLMAGPPAAK